MNKGILLICLFLAAALLGGCVSRPVIATGPGLSAVLPYEAAAEPEQHTGAQVLWGGSILALENRDSSTEVTILAYPLDRAQRPLPQAPSQGRFIIVLPGYVERHDYPDGLFVTLNGRIAGMRAGHVGERDYVFPLVEAEHVHRWPPGFQFDRPQWHIGIGVGVHIR
ncbi:outer membrane lipoprotein [Tahibacter aquaticus]|uniref:Outer membrane lipoprotein n=1 Tax=Tahibacter aquaticus TaxID=520092 RepID=A0A4R6YYL7_9GAMM|nr:Slp family lipoprotein [Tahibacter aquaticus]TDR44107.1 outer membrane lipoprotein [Tahibacter aquaticus]